MADLITVRIKLDATGAKANLQNINQQFSAADANAKRVGRSITETNKRIDRSVSLLRVYAGAWVSVTSAMAALRELGTVQNLERALSQVTVGTTQLNQRWQELTEISLRTRSDLEANIILFQRLTFSTERLGTSAEQVQEVLAGIAAGMRLGGATGMETASAIRQLSQAFSKGKLDGDEFRSVMENAGFLMVRFADQIGVSIAELRRMSRTGELTSDIMIEGFAKVADEMEAKLAAAPMTVDDALNNLRTTWLNFIKEIDQGDAAVIMIDLIRQGVENLTISIKGVRDQLVEWGVVSAKTSEEMISRRLEVMKTLQEERKELEDLQRRQQEGGFFSPTRRDIEAQQEVVNAAEQELWYLGVKFRRIKRIEAEQQKIVEQQKEAVALLAEENKQQQQVKRIRDQERKKEEQERKARKEEMRQERAMAGAGRDIDRFFAQEQRAADQAERNLMMVEQDLERFFEQEGAVKAVEKLQDQDQDQVGVLQRYAQDVMQLEEVFVTAFRGMEDALVSFVTTGELDFQKMVDSIISDLARLAIQQSITKPLAGAFAGAFGGQQGETQAGGIGGVGGGLGGLLGGFIKNLKLFQHGGSFTVGGRGGIDQNLVAFRASRGEQVTVTPAGQTPGVNVVMNLTVKDADSFVRNRNQVMNTLQTGLTNAQRNL